MSGEIKEDAQGVEIAGQDTIEFMQKRNNTKIDRVIVKGVLIDDIVSFQFRKDYTSLDVDFLGITHVQQLGTTTKYEPADEATGYIGLLPYQDSDFDEFKQSNFLYHMKSQKYIDHLVFSIFLKFENDDDQATSHIKLGGFDEDSRVLKDGYSMKYLKTENTWEWSLSLQNASLGNQDILQNITTSRHIQLYPNLPFIYIPPEDFKGMSNILNKIFNETICDGFKCVH